jgi:hypothetical protein
MTRVLIPGPGMDLYFRHRVLTNCESHPASYATSTGLKRPGHEAHLSPQFITEVSNAYSCISTPIRRHGVVLN